MQREKQKDNECVCARARVPAIHFQLPLLTFGEDVSAGMPCRRETRLLFKCGFKAGGSHCIGRTLHSRSCRLLTGRVSLLCLLQSFPQCAVPAPRRLLSFLL